MRKHNTLMAALAALIAALVAGIVSSIIGLAFGEKNIVVEALTNSASCFIIFFVAFLLLPLWDSSGRKDQDAKPSH